MDVTKTPWKKFDADLTKNLKPLKILRPRASNGLWLVFLLPACLCACSVRFRVSRIFLASSVCSIGLCLSSILFIIYSSFSARTLRSSSGSIVPALVTTIMCCFVCDEDIAVSLLFGVSTSFGFRYCVNLVLKVCPFSFTVGEALLVVQALTLFVFSSIFNIHSIWLKPPIWDYDFITIILQLGLLAVFMIIATLYVLPVKINVNNFSIVVGSHILLMLVTLHIILRRSPILWILAYLFNDFNKLLMVLYWAVASALAVVAVTRQTSSGAKASTARRKIFHVLAVMVYIPGFIYQCSLTYLASGIALAALIALETVRKLNFGKFSKFLNDGFTVFSDEKDAGGVSLTPMYLLVGVAAPLALRPSPCGGAPLLPNLSGVLSIGLGDTAASFVGSRYGRRKWPGSNKSIEGTVANAATQLALLYALYFCGFIGSGNFIIITSLLAILANVSVEAMTDQVDNLTLPLITLFILIFS